MKLTDQVKDFLVAAAKDNRKVVIVVTENTNVDKAYKALIDAGQVLIVRATAK